jgi:hypothetical protein
MVGWGQDLKILLMIYLNKLLLFMQIFTIKFLILLFIIFLCLFIVCLYKYTNKNLNYKIYNFYWNSFIIYIYFLIFIWGIFIMRFKRVGLQMDLIILFNTFKQYIITKEITFIIIIFLSCLIIILLLKHIKNYFIREVFKKHLYLYFNKKYKNILQHIAKKKSIYTDIVRYDYYIKLIDNIGGYNSYNSIIQRYKYYNILLPYSILSERDTYPKWMIKPLSKLLLLTHHIILLFVIICECHFNNWTLNIVFYFLPLYILIQMYKRITFFLENTSNELNRIIYERYYEEENVLYVNTTINEEKYILNYMKNDFICLSHEITNWDDKSILLNYPTMIINIRRFFTDKEHINIFVNYSTQEEFDIKDMLIKNDSLRNSMGFRYLIVPGGEDDGK